MIVDEYLTEVQKPKVNAPTFAYYVLYGKMPSPPIRGREVSHPTKKINGIDIDKNIPDISIKTIMGMSKLETTSSCEGKDKRHPTFLIIRLMDRNERASKTFVDKMNKLDKIKCGYDIGQGGLPRICVTWFTWNGHPDFNKWWKELPSKIKNSL